MDILSHLLPYNVCIQTRKDTVCGEVALYIAKLVPKARVFVYGPTHTRAYTAVKWLDTKRIGSTLYVDSSYIRVRPNNAWVCMDDKPTHVVCLCPDEIKDSMWESILSAAGRSSGAVFIGGTGERMKEIMKACPCLMHVCRQNISDQ